MCVCVSVLDKCDSIKLDLSEEKVFYSPSMRQMWMERERAEKRNTSQCKNNIVENTILVSNFGTLIVYYYLFYFFAITVFETSGVRRTRNEK